MTKNTNDSLTPDLQATLEEAKGIIEEGKIAEAEKLLKDLDKKVPNQPEILFELAKVYQKKEEHDKAAELLESIIPPSEKYGDLNYFAHCLYANVLIETGKQEKAAELIEKAEKLNPDGDWHKVIAKQLEDYFNSKE